MTSHNPDDNTPDGITDATYARVEDWSPDDPHSDLTPDTTRGSLAGVVPITPNITGYGAITDPTTMATLWVGLYANDKQEPRIEAHALISGATVLRLVIVGGSSPLHVFFSCDTVTPAMRAAIEFLKSQAYHRKCRTIPPVPGPAKGGTPHAND